MQFPEAARVVYRLNPLAEVIAQIQFFPILKIESDPPAAFQDSIRGDYPLYSGLKGSGVMQNLPPSLPPQLSQLMQAFGGGAGSPNVHQFASLGTTKPWTLTLGRDFLELKTTEYTRWEEFDKRFSAIRNAFEKIYQPAAFTRIGLKYVNIIRRSSIGLDNYSWSELLKPYIAGELSVPEFAGNIDSISRQLHCRLDEECFLTLKTGIAVAKPNGEQCFLIDNDFHTHKPVELKDAESILNLFNRKSGQFFRWCIERRLHDAMEPQPMDA